MARESGVTSKSLNCRISCYLAKKIEVLVETGEFQTRTDVVEAALHYYLNRHDLRQDMIRAMLSEADRMIDKNLEERLYSDENKEFLHHIVSDVYRSIHSEAAQQKP